MIFDTQEQKDFFFKVMRSYVCPYAESLDISQRFAPALQTAQILPVQEQQAIFNNKAKAAKALSEAVKKKVEVDSTEVKPPAGSDNGKASEEKAAAE